MSEGGVTTNCRTVQNIFLLEPIKLQNIRVGTSRQRSWIRVAIMSDILEWENMPVARVSQLLDSLITWTGIPERNP